MTGMNGVANAKSPYITAQFNHALLLQFAVFFGIVIVISLIVTIGFNKFVSKPRDSQSPVLGGMSQIEPMARKILRIGFGLIWMIDGLLQLQPQMPIGMPTQVVTPTIASAPSWLVSLVTVGTNAWLRHPVTAAAATVWLQIGLGLWLLIANRGWFSRSAGWVSAGWALSVWVLGNGLGTLYVAPISWLTGAPGAVLFYGLAGIAIGLNPNSLRRPLFALWTSRITAIGLGYFAILQAWPGRGFWIGGTTASPGPIPAMAQSMGQVSQPGFAVSIQHWFASATLTWSWLYNALVVVVLAGTAISFFTNKAKIMKWATLGYVVMALINWVLVQDFAVFGGVGTDLNSMIPSSVFLAGVYYLVRETEKYPVLEQVPMAKVSTDTAFLRLAGTTGAMAMFLLGAIPMVLVGFLPGTSADVAYASGGGVQDINAPAPNFTLTNQHGALVSIRDLRGKTVVLAFLDPVCTSDCPIEAQEMRLAGEQLGANSNTVFVAIDTNPLFRSVTTLQTFNKNEGLTNNTSWLYLTGSLGELQTAWNAYGVGVQVVSGGMITHAEPIYVIDPSGNIRSTWTAVVGSGTINSVPSQSGASLIVSQVKKAQS